MSQARQVIVIQQGARHSYAIPRMLERAGMLEALYTTTCVHGGIGSLVDAIPAGLLPERARRLKQRRVVGVPIEKIRVTDGPLFAGWLESPDRDLLTLHNVQDRAFGASCRRWGLGAADVVYSMFGEGTSFLRAARAAGVMVSIDVFISPVAHRIVQEESERYPDWSVPSDRMSVADRSALETRVAEVLALADVITCPSEHVLEGCRHYEGFDCRRAHLVPYSPGFDYGGRRNSPERGRLLFAGSASLRKGVHYFAWAASNLRSRGYDVHPVVVGGVARPVADHPESRALDLRGWLLRPALIEEYLRADVFVFPTLTEGSASVIYEAMAAGLPVVTTSNAGSIVKHGHDGLVVAAGDVSALSDAVALLLDDRGLRDRLASNALDTAQQHGERAWQARIVEVFSRAGVPRTVSVA